MSASSVGAEVEVEAEVVSVVVDGELVEVVEVEVEVEEESGVSPTTEPAGAEGSGWTEPPGRLAG